MPSKLSLAVDMTLMLWDMITNRCTVEAFDRVSIIPRIGGAKIGVAFPKEMGINIYNVAILPQSAMFVAAQRWNELCKTQS